MIPPSSPAQTLPTLTSHQDYALFLDVDGTIAEITETPDQTIISPQMQACLARLHTKLDGALALVSGRTIASLDRLCGSARYTSSGQHGMEIRLGDDTRYSPYANQDLIDEILKQLEPARSLSDDIVIEHKGLSIAVHYRRNPTLGPTLKKSLESLIAPYGPDIHLCEGKMVYEIRLVGADKGAAIFHLMEEPPFKNRTPIFVGDDVTDEDGFRAINQLDGISIKIGDDATAAHYQIATIGQLHDWLLALEEQLAKENLVKEEVYDG